MRRPLRVQLQRGSAHVTPSVEQVERAIDLMQTSAGVPAAGSIRPMVNRILGPQASVRLHTGTQGARVTALLGARAATAGQDLYFAPGEFRPDTARGYALLAHELAHTSQQMGVRPRIDSLHDDAEREAQTVERAVARSLSASTTSSVQHGQSLSDGSHGLAPATLARTAVPGTARAAAGHGALARVRAITRDEAGDDADTTEEPSLDELATQVYHVIRTRLAVELERRAWH